VNNKTILVTGASGYIGGRVVENLLKENYKVISMVRRPKQFKKKFKYDHEIRYGDTLKKDTLDDAFKNIDILFYFVHSMSDQQDFMKAETLSAKNVIEIAEKNNIEKIIYLGGLFKKDIKLSKHLESRKKVGEILRASSINCITFRASIIIGSGSLSFEMIRNLTESLPIMITPKWVRIQAQPISIRDVLKYLIGSIQIQSTKNLIFEIGGKDVVSYSDIMIEYAKQRNLKRFIIPVPLLTPYLSSLWLSLLTPIYATVGKKLIESIKHATVINCDEETKKYFPFETLSMSKSIKLSIAKEEKLFTNTHWASSYSSSGLNNKWLEIKKGNKLIYTKNIEIKSNAKSCFHIIQQIGGKNGWYYATFLWKIRGMLDLLFGGTGHKRGRKHPVDLHEGDFIDWWRVQQYNPPRILRLFAEMKLPGKAWLEFELDEKNSKKSILFITAIFDPNGLLGRLYWFSLYPLHFFIFNGLLKAIQKRTLKT
tara:strand:- start:9729 stop:11174 length:1446 start_codon:yes stop_codon:yes gene_type:complete